MIGKLLEWWVNRYYNNDKKSRSVMLIQGEANRTHGKVLGTRYNLKLRLYIAMIRDKDIRDIVLKASELYRETEDDPMEYMKKLFELNKEDNN